MSTDTTTVPNDLIQECCNGLKQYSYNCVNKAGYVNGSTICKYILAVRAAGDLSDNYRIALVATLSKLSQFLRNKSFKSMQRQDIIAFLNQYQKPESIDPIHKWIGTYNHHLTTLISFFKWLYYPNDTDRQKPDVVKNIGMKTRREKETYNHSDLWSLDDDNLFFKYCTSERLKCYHAISLDTSARPHELVALKIKDVQFRQNADGTQFVEVPVNGKTGKRFLPLFNSVPYVKSYLDHSHPQPNNPEAPFLCGVQKHLGKHIQPSRPTRDYADEKNAFTKLLDSPNVPPEDKAKIKLLLAKPWHAYIRRHTALTVKSSNPDIAAVLESHAGWKEGSKMKQKYIHHFQNKASTSILQAYGVLPKDPNELKLRVKHCPQCSEPNALESKFCNKCRMVLRYDSYKETIEKQQANENKVQELETKVKELEEGQKDMAQMFKERIAAYEQSYREYASKTDEERSMEREMKLRRAFPAWKIQIRQACGGKGWGMARDTTIEGMKL